ncbi:MAG: translational GTPase TypA [Clostridia bacterium]
MTNEEIRNVAIIAHVDHGKTTLVNEMLKQGNVFHENQVIMDRVMDSNAIERERGITILAKNASCVYGGVKINVVDTPGHADFGGEVERVLKMVDGVLLVVDAYEGTMPQTRFVLEKALALNLRVVVVINKIDRPDARLKEVKDEVLELLMELDANDEQMDSPFVYCSARQGVSSLVEGEFGTNLQPLFETILKHIPAPQGSEKDSFKMLISSAEYSEYLGRLAVGKVAQGSCKVGESVVVCNYHDKKLKYGKIQQLFEYQGLKRTPIDITSVGDILCIAGLEDCQIGDTICQKDNVSPIPFVKIDPPTVEMTFLVNDSPFAGKEGKYVTSRHLRERLYKESVKDLSLRVMDGETSEAFKVCGRGEMHLSILIENMRRDGYEFQVSMPRVLFKEIDGKKQEPVDRLFIDVPKECVGTIINQMATRKGEFVSINENKNRMKLEFSIPERGLFGFKSEFLTDTRGEGIMNSIFLEYQPYKGPISRRIYGSLIACETGDAIVYGLFNAQERGDLFIGANVKVYEGMIVGRNPKGEDIPVNVCKKKHLSNTRSSSSDEALRLVPIHTMDIEESIEFLNDDEYLEITPKSLRIRKVILNNDMRLKQRIKPAEKNG